MASTNKTNKLKLNSWLGSDKIARIDFNNDNLSIDNEFNQRGANVKWYGAVGDGVTDDTDAFRNCLSENKRIYIPKGNYVLSDTLSITTAHIIDGDSPETTFLLQKSNGQPIMRIVGRHWRISNIQLQFDTQQDSTMSGGIGIELGDSYLPDKGAYEGCIDNVIIYRPYRGIAISDWDNNPFAYMVVMKNIRVLDAYDYAYHLAGMLNMGLCSNTLINCYALGQSDPLLANPNNKGFYIAMHDEFTMLNCACDHSFGVALHLEYNRGGTIVDFHAEGCNITGNYSPLVNIYNSTVNFTGLTIHSPIARAGVTSESSMFYVGGNSQVNVVRYTDTTIDNQSAGTIRSLVNEETAVIHIDQFSTQLEYTLRGKSTIGKRTSYADTMALIKGTYAVGDIIYCNYPKDLNCAGWVCTTAGTVGGTPTPAFTPFGALVQGASDRPWSPLLGQMFFDTAIGKPIWWNGTNWKDATGTTV